MYIAYHHTVDIYIYLWCSLNVRSFHLVNVKYFTYFFLHNNLILDFESMLIVHFVSVESILMFCSTEIYRFYFN